MSKETGGPAFPEVLAVDAAGDIHAGDPGMMLRDYFAAKAMQGELSSQSNDDDVTYDTIGDIKGLAVWCYAMADAMLAERAK